MVITVKRGLCAIVRVVVVTSIIPRGSVVRICKELHNIISWIRGSPHFMVKVIRGQFFPARGARVMLVEPGQDAGVVEFMLAGQRKE